MLSLPSFKAWVTRIKFMKLECYSDAVYTKKGKFAFVHDWYSANLMTGIYPHKFSYMKNRVANNLKRIVLKKQRVCYKSSPQLSSMQDKLMTMFVELWETIPEEDRSCVISYIKGLDPRKKVAENAGATCAISFDIRKYYDNIHYYKIVEALNGLGMNKAGAKLLTSYCVVDRSYLQQGSSCSPVLSNIVGYHFFDQVIKAYLKENYPELNIKYLRYCDNFVLFFHCPVPEDFYAKYKEFIAGITKSAGFNTHKWMKVTNNNPKKNIQWLGIILNDMARVDRKAFDSIRGELFSHLTQRAVRDELFLSKCADDEVLRLEHGWGGVNAAKTPLLKKYMATLRGKISYIKSISEKQGLQLLKLYTLLDRIVVNDESTKFRSLRSDEGFDALKTYKHKEETLEEFISKFFV